MRLDKRKSKLLILVASFIVITVLIIITISNRPTEIIVIGSAPEYFSRHYTEFFVVVRPPRDAEALLAVIKEFNESNQVVVRQIPMGMEYVQSYGRIFFRESSAFPRDMLSTDEFFSNHDLGLTTEWTHNWIASITGERDYTRYVVSAITREISFGLVAIDRERLSYTTPSDPTLNGLFNNIP
jgi:hypothetical protein